MNFGEKEKLLTENDCNLPDCNRDDKGHLAHFPSEETDSDEVTDVVCSYPSLARTRISYSRSDNKIGQNWTCQVSRIYREANRYADHLARKALSVEIGFVNLCSPPATWMIFIWENILGPGSARLSFV